MLRACRLQLPGLLSWESYVEILTLEVYLPPLHRAVAVAFSAPFPLWVLPSVKSLYNLGQFCILLGSVYAHGKVASWSFRCILWSPFKVPFCVAFCTEVPLSPFACSCPFLCLVPRLPWGFFPSSSLQTSHITGWLLPPLMLELAGWRKQVPKGNAGLPSRHICLSHALFESLLYWGALVSQACRYPFLSCLSNEKILLILLIHMSNNMISAPAHTVPVLCLGVQKRVELAICPWRAKGSMSEYEFADLSMIWAARSAIGASEAFLSQWWWSSDINGDCAAQRSQCSRKPGFRAVGQC